MANKPFWHISDFVLASYILSCVKMSDFVLKNRHLREVLLFFFHSNKTATEAHWEIEKVHGDAALSETTCRDWFRRFKDGDFDVEDRPRQWRPTNFEDAELEALLDEDSCQTQEEFASALGVTRQAISKRLYALGMIQKQGTWVPYNLKATEVELRFFDWEQLLQRQKGKGFLHRIVAGDEKWIHYSNPKRRKSWELPGHAPIFNLFFVKLNNIGHWFSSIFVNWALSSKLNYTFEIHLFQNKLFINCSMLKFNNIGHYLVQFLLIKHFLQTRNFTLDTHLVQSKLLLKLFIVKI